ncbi:ATP-binding protein (macronuclear) [Tetrahymena thermophila SB210]|uniref:GPN-loop GTPase 3 n=1 Tax=Tetrahymena thermophila (strain SB210) TaxID=312017 RepID=I7MD37_TETTS|nr:ATP-binding protein [Tetrahymena thermophila SB210]EAR85433.1 ATP-binding protein [Tetrahymena thermophila SB210]|eukprot:XP_001033096.1 ATP-binding protein [Tetrahymena thermophila SB210]
MNQGVFYGQVIVGPAGSGKSTYCHIMQDNAKLLKRNIMVVNLDPAAEHFKYRCDIDIRDLITLDDVMEEFKLGPNGGLVYCMEYLLQNIDWLEEQLCDLATDDYVLFDCPGQIELYTHMDLMNKLTQSLSNLGFSVCSMYMLDVTFISDNSKFISGVLQALTAMISLGLPHITVLTKCDIIQDKKQIDEYLEFSEEIDDIEIKDTQNMSEFDKKYNSLTRTLRETIKDYSLVGIRKLDVSDEETILDLLAEADMCLNYGENLEPDERFYEQVEDNLQKGNDVYFDEGANDDF